MDNFIYPDILTEIFNHCLRLKIRNRWFKINMLNKESEVCSSNKKTGLMVANVLTIHKD